LATSAQRTGIFSQRTPDNFRLNENLTLANMGLGDKAAALALSERAIAANPIEKDALIVPGRLRFSPGWLRRQESPTARLPLYKNCSQYRAVAD